MARRCLPWIVLLGAVLHVLGLARAIVPAQDGLKYLRVARQFQAQPWLEVIRGSDQHPLYPACIAVVQPIVATVFDDRPTSWRVAAQAVSAIASLVLLVPLFGLSRSLFDEQVALLATLMFVLLPLPAEVGRDTLADALALLAFTWALWSGELALRRPTLGAAVGCGFSAGIGYWARPEVVVAPLAVSAVATSRLVAGVWKSRSLVATPPAALPSRETARLAALALSVLVFVGSYALVKGELSEKLALRWGAAIASRHDVARKVGHPLPPGLDDPRWDFSAKEESSHAMRLGCGAAVGRLGRAWAEGMGWLLVPMVVVGAVRVGAGAGRWVIASYAALFGLILVRHAMTLGYLSGRHILTLVVVSLPWAAAGTLAVVRRVVQWRCWEVSKARRLGRAAMAILIVSGLAVQAVKPAHPTRWGHWAAGRWLVRHARPGDAVLDTRGWAAFVSGRPSYDYWHVRQALSDARLAFVVVGADELHAPSRRAATLRALLAFAAEPVASFPGRQDGTGADVRIFRFRRPESWEHMIP